MRMGKLGRSLVALTLIGLAAAGCTPDPGPTPTPAPTPSVSQTPTESPQELQQRLDYEAAEKSYRTFRAEYNRVLRAGGAKAATSVMKATAGGPYLTELLDGVKAYRALGSYDTGVEEIVYVRRAGYSATSIALDVCEDSRKVETFDKSRKYHGKGELLAVRLEVRKSDRWRVWSGSGETVQSCE